MRSTRGIKAWVDRRLDALRGGLVEHDLSSYAAELAAIAAWEPELQRLSDDELAQRAHRLRGTPREDDESDAAQAFALVREAARRELGQRPFDVQVVAGLAMLRGRVAELATGEGKTLAAVAPAFVRALSGHGSHVLTFNDYLARRDAAWMGPVYRRLGLTVGCVQDGMEPAERRRAYACDVTYLTAKEAGFDYLRDGLVLDPSLRVRRPFHFALVDEADSILIDEARIPLVIAGETGEASDGVGRIAEIARRLRPGADFDTDEYRHNIALTDAGIARAQDLLGVADLYARECLTAAAQLRNALHAEHLLARDVDYIVRHGRVELVDDFTGRVAEKRHWPDGLQAAIEAKEGVRLQAEGRILGSITLQHFLRLYPCLCGMTATAQAAAEELMLFYGLRVAVIPTHRPMIRVDDPDVVFTHAAARDAALVREIAGVHRTGRPVLVGTASVDESERLARALAEAGLCCQVLNAKNDEQEAVIVSRAGSLGAVTISTNMAGRGTDIRLGGPDEAERREVEERGGLYVIGTHRHASRRVDLQLRGRAGRQGDPGSSRFFVSLEDDLVERYGVQNLVSTRGVPRQDRAVESDLLRAEIARAQRIVEGESREVRKGLYAYSDLVERQRARVRSWRDEALSGEGQSWLAETCPERYAHLLETVGEDVLRAVERRIRSFVIDHCWSDYLAEVAEIRDDSHLLAFAGKVPLAEFHRQVGVAFLALEERIDEEAARTFERIEVTPDGVDWDKAELRGPSSTWTYLIGENPFEASAHTQPGRRVGMLYVMWLLGPLAWVGALGVLMPALAKRRKGRRS